MRVHFYLNKPVGAKEKHHYCYQTTRKGRKKKVSIRIEYRCHLWQSKLIFLFFFVLKRDDSLFAAYNNAGGAILILFVYFLEEEKNQMKIIACDQNVKSLYLDETNHLIYWIK
jgi:hypothetical protein